jgi:hypothetical protein
MARTGKAAVPGPGEASSSSASSPCQLEPARCCPRVAREHLRLDLHFWRGDAPLRSRLTAGSSVTR